MSKKVLVVDDSRVSRMMIGTMIRDAQSDWEVFEAGNGAEALVKADECQPDLITMDINMPVMDGFEAATQLRPKFPGTTLIILSANIQASSKARADELGVHFLAKPISETVVKQALAIWASEHE